MARPLKVFRAHLGFYDTVVAASSQKAAAAAWGANAREFAQGFANVTQDAKAVEAALAQPGVVLRRPAGSHGPFKADPDKPAAPRLTKKQKQRAAQAEQKAAAKARQKAEREKRAEARRAAAAEAELAEIEAEEAKLRERRRTLRKSFSLRSVK